MFMHIKLCMSVLRRVLASTCMHALFVFAYVLPVGMKHWCSLTVPASECPSCHACPWIIEHDGMLMQAWLIAHAVWTRYERIKVMPSSEAPVSVSVKLANRNIQKV